MEVFYSHWQRPIMCQHCRQMTATPAWVTHRIGRSTMQYAFCNLSHANLFYIGKHSGYEL